MARVERHHVARHVVGATCTARTAARAAATCSGVTTGADRRERVALPEAVSIATSSSASGYPMRRREQETVDLRLRQRERPLELDGVLRGEHEERRRQRVRDAVDGDPALLHGLQEGGLRARRGAVDLVGEDDVGEQRARTELELPARWS